MFRFMKSTRSIAVILTYVIIIVALIKGELTGANVMALSTMVLGAYFGKRDSKSDRL